MVGTFSRSFRLVKESFAVLKKDKEIILFPIISAIASIILLASFVLPIYFYTDIPAAITKGNIAIMTDNYLYYLLLFVFYLFGYFIIIFFNTGLVTCAYLRLKGGDPTFGDGFKNALKHIKDIFLWALISATVGMVLRLIARRSNTLGKTAVGIAGMAWSLLTFFVIPVMVLENKGVGKSIEKSTELFRKTWGENVVGQFSMGLFFLILAIIGVIPLAMIAFTGSLILIVSAGILVILYWVILAIISSSLDGIFVAALYIYADTGKVSSVYSRELIRNVFRSETISRI
ncbi:MAG: hypothetical protein HYW24_00030 [Candidatus Aenigmarchaeota archaeon]|nr:hypothetical protein [Candidatus Aenigmarchaeota archaeon]